MHVQVALNITYNKLNREYFKRIELKFIYFTNIETKYELKIIKKSQFKEIKNAFTFSPPSQYLFSLGSIEMTKNDINKNFLLKILCNTKINTISL